MGRLVGVPHFLTQEALDEEKADLSSLRRAKTGDSEDAVAGSDNDILECQMAIAHRMQKQFMGRILRRTTDSKDWEGKPLISIPPHEEIRIIVKPTEREMDIISELSDDVKDRYAIFNPVFYT
jgi:SNF2 family DNA or RNA helicase